MNWTSPNDLREQVKKLWERGDLLASVVAAHCSGVFTSEYPKRLTLKCPNATELRDHFEEARNWSRKLREMPHLRVEWREFNHRTLGANALPESAWLDNVESAAALLNRQRDLRALRALLSETQGLEPSLLVWVARRPLKALSLMEDWTRLLHVVAWMKVRPNPKVYLRQIDVPEVHSKFIEQHRAVLAEMIDIAAPACIIDPSASGIGNFARRYGFCEKPERVRFRLLGRSLIDPSYWDRSSLNNSLTSQESDLPPISIHHDIELDASAFAALTPRVSRVFITENEVNFLAFPHVPGGMVIFGAGYGFSALREAHWLHQCEMQYWGDIDTHGFAILNELRARFPHVKSLLMDRTTLMQFRPLWGRENSSIKANLVHLSREEAHLYDDLRDNVLGEAVRFEQERVSYSWVVEALG